MTPPLSSTSIALVTRCRQASLRRHDGLLNPHSHGAKMVFRSCSEPQFRQIVGCIMFVQIIEGKVSDPAGLRRQLDRWQAELRPGASGYLGSTSGISDDGTLIAFARFESAEAAKANSERAEQGAWWSETERCFDGPVSFIGSEDVEEFLAGGSNDAGFVQVMKTRGGIDRATMKEMDNRFEKHASTWRPDLIGGVRVWTGGEHSTIEMNYFTSEAEARNNETREPPAELAEMFVQFSDMMADTEFVDLRDPWLF
jgi:hypothetical protein